MLYINIIFNIIFNIVFNIIFIKLKNNTYERIYASLLKICYY